MMALVERMYDAETGSVAVDGVDVRAYDSTWLRRQIGTVAQEPTLFAISIMDNIRYGRMDASDAEVGG